MTRTTSLRRAETKIERRSPPSQDDTTIQGEEEIVGMGGGSLIFRCLRIKSGIRRGSCRSSILWIRLVRTMKSQMAWTSNTVIVIIALCPVKESISVPKRHDMGLLNLSIVGSWLIVVLNWLQFLPLK